MSVEVSIICDTRSAIIAAHRGLAAALRDARSVGAVRVGLPPKDVCRACLGTGSDLMSTSVQEIP
jgi:hypothetical protein